MPPKRSPAHYLWAVLIARIHGVFPLLCPMCGGQMCLIAFITEGAQIRKILDHIGVDSLPPHISPARGSPLWDDCDAQMGEGVAVEPDWDMAAQLSSDYDVDQRINWQQGETAIQMRCGVVLRVEWAVQRKSPSRAANFDGGPIGPRIAAATVRVFTQTEC